MADSEKPVGIKIIDGVPNAPLFVIFGGIKGNMNMPPFEFTKFMQTHFPECGYIYLRDHHQAWYFRGVQGFAESNTQLTAELDKLISSKEKSQTIFMGNSMGGFAAILYGVLLNVDTVLAFSPQTFINAGKRTITKDIRWMKEILRLWKVVDSDYFDLHYLKNTKDDHPEIHVFHSKKHKLDTIHALNIAHYVNLHPYNVDNHNVVRHLRDTDELAPLLRKYIK